MSDDGNISEWSEGNFKSKRLHDLQESINYLLTRPLGFSGKSTNFEEAFRLIIALYDEGRPKYNTKEAKECDEYQRLIEYALGTYPAYNKVTNTSYNGNKSSLNVNPDNLGLLINLIQNFNRKVRYYNDKRGLSTRNKSKTKDLF